MTTACLTLWVPGKVPNLNDLLRMKGSRYRGSYNRVKKLWSAKVLTASRQQDLFARHTFGRYYLTLHVVEKDKRRDPMNVIAGAEKFVTDGLISAGVVAGDGWKHILGVTFGWSVDADHPGVRITLTEAT